MMGSSVSEESPAAGEGEIIGVRAELFTVVDEDEDSVDDGAEWQVQ